MCDDVDDDGDERGQIATSVTDVRTWSPLLVDVDVSETSHRL